MRAHLALLTATNAEQNDTPCHPRGLHHRTSYPDVLRGGVTFPEIGHQLLARGSALHRVKTMRKSNLALVVTTITLFTGGLWLSHAQADGPKPCIKAKQQTPQVQAACDAGGLEGAKKMMKEIVDKQKKAGNQIKCQTCHKDLKGFELTPNGLADLKKML